MDLKILAVLIFLTFISGLVIAEECSLVQVGSEYKLLPVDIEGNQLKEPEYSCSTCGWDVFPKVYNPNPVAMKVEVKTFVEFHQCVLGKATPKFIVTIPAGTTIELPSPPGNPNDCPWSFSQTEAEFTYLDSEESKTELIEVPIYDTVCTPVQETPVIKDNTPPSSNWFEDNIFGIIGVIIFFAFIVSTLKKQKNRATAEQEKIRAKKRKNNTPTPGPKTITTPKPKYTDEEYNKIVIDKYAKKAGFVDYHEYIQSDEWREKRKEKLIQADYQCEKCGTGKNLVVHHITYDRLGNEEMDDLVVLCKTHHNKTHEND